MWRESRFLVVCATKVLYFLKNLCSGSSLHITVMFEDVVIQSSHFQSVGVKHCFIV